jgi:hypothetical protein
MLQLLSVVVLYVKTLISSTKPTEEIRRVAQFVMSNRSAIKKRKMIGEIGDPCGIPVAVVNGCDCPSNVLSVVVLSLRKLSIQRTITSGIRRLERYIIYIKK